MLCMNCGRKMYCDGMDFCSDTCREDARMKHARGVNDRID